ncbi:MAG TPA: hypothetical protein VFA20_18900 [Myxococcaceae bacterium]|nr:hypothetical protein [Myxococcaceae bacterium]
MRLVGIALALALAGCQVPPLEQVTDGKSCDGDAGHACAPGYQCCRGACITEGQTCCVPESDAVFCNRLQKVCVGGSGLDNCGDPRTVTSCPAESDAEFCSNHGAACGSYSNTDSCGSPRTADCGNCTTAPNLSCVNNACACVPDPPAQLCSRAGVQCGEATVTDNCGTTRTVTCPGCTAPEACGGRGTAGQCGCIPVGSTGCGATGTACCGGTCGSTGPRCCLALGDTCAGGIAGECCQGICDAAAGYCCRLSGGACADGSTCCSGFCDDVSHKCQ